ncbi:alpha,alpha-trehalase [Wickerhamomyces ciferrii]|uniref:alpha,alpha-trehalase n=1 Tax=Wickerhamomyces ciferrii (strain ATCC 14091 / BCRC 22168 / CBS 111 / JCM 3599 / NBRC 0793 / NRRL Y-1031 F-60-10) TaxID=1206466 RepID=K0KH76_WICCF|nr:alpha,alpha-trehalase [Wickerhamomyces ciferrii]CCH44570.1 alpha,alpha-trehalase [Wickerhamomyces ciferrii]
MPIIEKDKSRNNESRQPKTKRRKTILFSMTLLFPTLLVLLAFVPTVVLNTVSPFDQDDEKARWLKMFEKSEKLFRQVPDSGNAFYDERNNILGHTHFSKNVYSRQAYVSNGYIGARLSTLGQGFTYDQFNIHANSMDEEFLKNGWPLFNKRYTGAFVSGFFDLEPELPDTNFPELYANGSDSVISAIPYWPVLQLHATIGGQHYIFDPQQTFDNDVTNYVQNLSLQNGIVSTRLTWLNKVNVKINVMAHKQIAPLGLISMELSAVDEDVEMIVQDQLNLTTAQRSVLQDIGVDDLGIYMQVTPNNIDYSRVAVYSRLDLNDTHSYVDEEGQTVINEHHFTLTKEKFKITKYAGIISTEYQERGTGSELENAKKIVDFAQSVGLQQLYDSHNHEWDEQFKETNIYIPGSGFLTLAARSSLYHLYANTRIGTRDLTSALGTTGLSSDSYGGMTFWDTDLWIVPAILPFAPQVAKCISQYRNFTHNQAIENAQEYGFEGAAYPWTSGRFGNCTSTGPCVNYEYHLNVDIAYSSWLIYLASGDEEYLRYTAWPILRDASNFLTDYVTFNTTLNQFTTHNLTDPDEYANHVDNGAFTNAGIDSLMKWTLMAASHLGEPINPKWAKVNDNVYIPRSEDGITLEYIGMNASVSIKQADVVLLTFPLDFNDHHSYEDAERDLYYYSIKQADVGPAMTFPVFSIASAKLLNKGCSVHSYLQKSVLPYLRAPFAQFSEQADDNTATNGGTNPAFPFMTGHGGYLQALVYGVHGLRFSVKLTPDGKLDRFLTFDPIAISGLPGGVKISGFKYSNQLLDVIVTDIEGIIIHKGDDPIEIEVRERNPKTGRYTLQPGEKLKVPLFVPGMNIDGSTVECKPITNLTVGVPGDVPLSAIDGNNYTYWQPLDREPARLLIDLGFPQKLSKGLIIWGERPAKTLSIYGTEEISLDMEEAFMNIENIKFTSLVDKLDIETSEPYKEEYSKDIKLLPNNITEFEIGNNTLFTKFIIVEITDALDPQEPSGATVNEVALFQ